MPDDDRMAESAIPLCQNRLTVPSGLDPAPSFPWVKLSLFWVLVGLIYYRVWVDLLHDWWTDPALSQGMIIPPLALYIAWMRKSWTLDLPAVPDNRGLIAIFLSSLTFLVGKLGAEFFLLRISFVMLLMGVTWTWWGYARLRSLFLPFLLLATMVPLPKVVYNSLSTPLQLFASDASATLAGNLGVTAFRDGNAIHLANATLGVESACSGLNSLSSLAIAAPLLGALICSRFYTRFILIALTIPVALGVNIVRITGTAVLSDHDPRFAMGYYHFFSGWLIFASGFAFLYLIATLLHRGLDWR